MTITKTKPSTGDWIILGVLILGFPCLFAVLFFLFPPDFVTDYDRAKITAASDSEIAGMRIEMEDYLKDAESARFKDVIFFDSGRFCGYVNAKNTYGAYAGYKIFYGIRSPSKKNGYVMFSFLIKNDDDELKCVEKIHEFNSKQ